MYGDPNKGSRANGFLNPKWPVAIRFSAKRQADIGASGTLLSSTGLITAGGTLHVSCENVAYQPYAAWAWLLLPASAIRELRGLTAFAANILGTFLFEPSHAQKQPLVEGMPYGIL